MRIEESQVKPQSFQVEEEEKNYERAFQMPERETKRSRNTSPVNPK